MCVPNAVVEKFQITKEMIEQNPHRGGTQSDAMLQLQFFEIRSRKHDDSE